MEFDFCDFGIVQHHHAELCGAGWEDNETSEAPIVAQHIRDGITGERAVLANRIRADWEDDNE